MHGDEAFVEAICAAPADDVARLVYADWLEERGDSRGNYLRVVHEIALLIRQGENWDKLKPQLLNSAEAAPQAWRDLVGKRFNVVLESFRKERKIETVAVVRLVTGVGLKDAKDMVEAAPTLVRKGILLEDVAWVKEKMELGWWYEGQELPANDPPCCCVRIDDA